jgi:LysM repeat protein
MARRALKLTLSVILPALFLLGAGLALAQEEEATEPPAAPPAEAAPAVRDIPALVLPAEHVIQAAKDVGNAGATQVAQAPARNPTATTPKVRKYFPYTVLPGDSLGKVAASFGVSPDELARLNHIHQDDELYAGDVLKIPNPFEAESKALKAEVARLSTTAGDSSRKLEALQTKTISLSSQNAELLAENSTFRGAAVALRWWRGTVLGIVAAGLLMLGITLLTLFEWWTLRRRFVALSDLTESLAHLDVKYKEMLAKAELRMQQLYGRRRGAGGESPERGGKTPEEVEIERLGHELKQTLERYLERLGVRARASGRRSRWGETLEGGESPVEAPSARR